MFLMTGHSVNFAGGQDAAQAIAFEYLRLCYRQPILILYVDLDRIHMLHYS